MKKFWATFLILTITTLACKNGISDEELQQEVVKDVFLEIIDSTYIDRRIYTLFPENGKSIYDKNGKWLKYDSVSQHLNDLKWESKIEKIKKNTSKLVIGIVRNNWDLEENDYQLFYKHFKNLEKGGAIQNKNSIIFPIDLNKITKNNKFIFKNNSEFPNSYEIWQKKYPFQFGSIITCSNACFDISKKHGFINVGVTCGGLCGRGYLIFIKKINGKWKIDKIEETWIA
jgi:hypothetical protein